MTNYNKWDAYDECEDGEVDLEMKWTNTVEEANLDIMLPDGVQEECVLVKPCLQMTIIRYYSEGVVKSMTIPHPRIKQEKSSWKFGIKEADGKEVPIIHIVLNKEVPKMWDADSFLDKERIKKRKKDRAHWHYSFDQENERVSIWFQVPAEIVAKDVQFHCKSNQLTIYLTSCHDLFSRYFRAPVYPDESIWTFDDDENEGRRIRVDLVIRELASWSEGPFLDADVEDYYFSRT